MIHHGDCLDIMPTLDAESIDAIVTDPPYGLEFMGKEWDKLGWQAGGGFSKPGIGDRPTSWPSFSATERFGSANPTCATCGGRLRGARKCGCDEPAWKPIGKRRNPENEGLPDDMTGTGMARQMNAMQAWHEAWAREALRVAKPGAYLLAFGGTRTVHRLACAIEDAGWIIRDMLVWGYASGFPKSKASLKPAWEPIVMARKPGPLRMLAIDGCRIGTGEGGEREGEASASTRYGERGIGFQPSPGPRGGAAAGRWPANIVLTDPIFDGGIESVVGGGETASGKMLPTVTKATRTVYGQDAAAGYTTMETYGDSGTYSRFFLVPKAARADREPVLGGLAVNADKPLGALGNKFCTLCGESWVAADGWPKCGHGRENTGRRPALNPKARANGHPTVKPTELMRHLVRLVTPPGGIVLDPFLGSGTTALAAEMEGFAWVGIEREEEYVRIAEARLNGTQKGMAL